MPLRVNPKNLTLETTDRDYTPNIWCHIYTDTSAEGGAKNEGAGIIHQKK